MKKQILFVLGIILAILMLGTLSTVSAADINSGLVLYLSFDNEVGGAVPDITGNGWNGKLMGNAMVTDVVAKFGKALYLDGSDGYVEIPKGVNLALEGEEWSISVWCMIEELRNFQRVFDFNNTSATFFYMSPSTSDLIPTYRAKINNGTRDTLDSYNVFIDENEWYHVVVSQKGSTVNFYINGELALSNENCINNMATYDIPLEQCWIGKSATASDAMYFGAIDDFRLYNRALTADEVTALFKYTPGLATSNTLGEVKIDIVEKEPIVEVDGGIVDDLVVYLPFDGVENGISADATGNGWNANLMGSATIADGGKFGSALYLDGVDAYAQIKEGVNLALDPNKKEWTVSVWFKQDEARGYALIMDFNNTNATFFYIAPSTGGSEGTYRAKINNGPRDTVDMVGKNLNADEWYMLTVVQNGDAVKVYVNGELVTVNEYCVNANMATYGEPLLYCYLGKSATESDPMFVGMIDEFRLYNRALSASDIATLYKLDPNAAPVEGPAETPTVSTGTVTGGAPIVSPKTSDTAITAVVVCMVACVAAVISTKKRSR